MTALQITYFALVALVVEGEALPQRWLVYSTKPLLMPVLALFLWARVRASGPSGRGSTPTALVVSLTFAWLGDLFLMSDRGFAAGLAAFLVMQCAYISMLWPARGRGFLRPANLAPGALVIASFFIQYSLVQANLGPMRLPAIVYFGSLSATLFLAATRYVDGATPTNATILVGLALFYVSDSLLALSTFHHPFPLSGAAVMLTYASGQYLFLSSYVRAGTHQ